MKHKRFLKGISLTLALSMLHLDLVWALDVRQKQIDDQLAIEALFEGRRQANLQGQYLNDINPFTSSNEINVSQDNALLELEELNFTLTTQGGDLVQYVNNQVQSIKRPDGTILTDISFDPNQNITGAFLDYTDGSFQLVRDGRVVEEVKPNGTRIEYDAVTGRVLRESEDAANFKEYTYDLNALGAVIKTRIETFRAGQTDSLAQYDAAGILTSFEKANGQKTIYVNGRLKSFTTSDGKTINYLTQTLADGSVRVYADLGMMSPPALPVHPYFEGVSQGQIVSGAVFIKPNIPAVLSANNAIYIKKVFYYLNGTQSGRYYASPFMWGDADGFDTATLSDGSYSLNTVHTVRVGSVDKYVNYTVTFTVNNTSSSSGGATQLPDVLPYEVIYDPSGKVRTVEDSERRILLFTDNLLTSVTGSDGTATFDFSDTFPDGQKSLLGNILDTRILKNGISSHYDASGQLARIDKDNLKIHFKEDESEIDFIEMDSGVEIYAPVFTNGAITSAEVFDPQGNRRVYCTVCGTPDGFEVVYDTPTLFRYTSAEDIQYDFGQSGEIRKLTLPNSLVYDFSALKAGVITAKLSPISENLTIPQNTVETYEYDASYTLRKMIRRDKEIIELNSDSTLSKIYRLDELSNVTDLELFSYTTDTNGKPLTTVTQGNVRTTFDEFRNPLESIISPSAERPETLVINYRYGKIREVLKDGALTLVYSYDYDSSGVEILTITDKEDLSDIKTITYRDGVRDPNEELDLETQILKTYLYQKDGRVKEVIMTRLGRHLRRYLYAYQDADTLVTDEEGVVRTYAKNAQGQMKLTTLERDSHVYRYDYALEEVSSQVITQTLAVNTLDANLSGTSWSVFAQENALGNTKDKELLQYNLVLDQDGKLDVSVDAVNFGTAALPQGYTHFQIEVFLDGVSRGIQLVPASKTEWKSLNVTLLNVSKGNHTVGFKWLNNVEVAPQAPPPPNPTAKLTGISEGQVLSSVVFIGPNMNVWPKGLKKVSYYINGTLSGKNYSTPYYWGGAAGFNTASLADGNYRLSGTVTLPGSGGDVNFDAVNFKINNTNPPQSTPAADTNLKIKNLNITHSYTQTIQEEVVTETLSHRKLSDGSVAYYGTLKLDANKAVLEDKRGEITRIERPDGALVDNIVMDPLTGSVKTARLTRSGNQTQWVINQTEVIEEIRPDGTHLYYKNNRAWKVTDPQGNERLYSYTFDSDGSLVTTELKNQTGSLVYDALGNLTALKLDGVDSPNTTPTNLVTSTFHEYTPLGESFLLGNNAGAELDGDPDTEYARVLPSCGSTCEAKITSQHEYMTPHTVESITFKASAVGHGHGEGNTESNALVAVEVFRNGAWETVDVTHHRDPPSGNNSTDSYAKTDGLETYTNLGITGVTKIRAVAKGYGHAESSPSTNADVHIYEFDAEATSEYLKNQDLSIFNFALDNSQRVFTGARGEMRFDAAGSLLSFTPGIENLPNGASGNLPFMDKSALNNFIKNKNVTLSTTAAPVGNASAKFNGLSSFLYIQDNGGFDFDSGDFTLEEWASFDSLPGAGSSSTIFEYGSNVRTMKLALKNDSGQTKLELQIAGDSYSFDWNPGVGAWHHLALAREGSVIRIYVDGVQLGYDITNFTNLKNLQDGIRIGSAFNGTNFFHGKLDEIRFTKGTAMYTQNFTPRVTRLNPASGDVLLLHFDDEIGYALTQAQDASLSLVNKVQNLIRVPYFDSLSSDALALTREEAMSLYKTASDARLASDTVVAQEYTALGVMETQTKSDKTTVVYDADKPAFVLDKDGNALIEYGYDSEGNLSEVKLIHARQTLPQAIHETRMKINEERRNALSSLASEEPLIKEEIRLAFEAAQEQIDNYIFDIESGRGDIASIAVKGKVARKQKADILRQYEDALESARLQKEQLLRQEADTYANINEQIKSASLALDNDTETSFLELNRQKKLLEEEILKQEASPVVFDVYRRILGRDPSSQEYQSWIDKVDFKTGGVFTGPNPQTPGPSAYFNGADGYLAVEKSPLMSLNQAEWSIDFWVDPKERVNDLIRDSSPQGGASLESLVSGPQTLFEVYRDADNRATLEKRSNGALHLFIKQSGITILDLLTPASSILDEAWSHVALVKNGLTFSLYINGIRLAVGNTASALSNLDAQLEIGRSKTRDVYGRLVGDAYYSGHLDEFRFTNKALWLSNFTPSKIETSPTPQTMLQIKENLNGLVTYQDIARGLDVDFYGGVVPEEYVTPMDWPNTTSLVSAMVDELMASTERVDRIAYVTEVVGNVTTAINDYMALQSNQEKVNLAQARWGLKASDLIALSVEDKNAILGYLNRQVSEENLHFGQSAELALSSMLDARGISYERENILTDLIVVDILSGVITPLDEEDLVISMDAINKVSASYQMNTTSANLSWEDLKNIYDATGVLIGEEEGTEPGPGSSMSFDGKGDFLYIADSPLWDLGTSNFTVEFSVRIDELKTYIPFVDIGKYNSGVTMQYQKNNGWIEIAIANSFYQVYFTPQINTWYDLSLVRKEGVLELYVNGTKQLWRNNNHTNSSNITSVTEGVGLGASLYQADLYDLYLKGRMDGVRVSNKARYTDNYTPGNVRFEDDSDTLLLVYSDSDASSSPVYMDSSSRNHTLTVNGNVALDNTSYSKMKMTTVMNPVLVRAGPYKDLNTLSSEEKDQILEDPNQYNHHIIAHISGNHYVVITSMTDDTITYIDPGMGKDKENESLTITKEGFLEVWKGNVILETEVFQQQVTEYQQKELSEDSSRAIRGAFWGSLLNIAAWIVSIALCPVDGCSTLFTQIIMGLRVASMIASIAEGDWISAISSVVTFGFDGGFKFASDFFKSAIPALGGFINGVGTFFKGLFDAVTGIGNAVKGALEGFVHLFGIGGRVAGEIAKFVVHTGFSIGISTGLNAIGIDSDIARYAGSLVSGAIVGGISKSSVDSAGKAISISQQIRTNVLNTVIMQDVGSLGLELGLDSDLIGIIGLSLGTIKGQQILNPSSFSFGSAFKNILPQLGSTLGTYGISKLGESFGLDPRITGVIGSTIGSVINPNYELAQREGNIIINAINDGLIRGATSVGIDYLVQEADLDPFVGAIASRAITGALAGAIDPKINIFEGVFNAFKTSTLNVLTLGQNSGMSQTQYLQNVIRFSDLISERGLKNAIEAYATAIFHRDSVESIIDTFDTIGDFIQDAFDNNRTVTVNVNGQNIERIHVDSNDLTSDSIGLDENGNLVEIRRGRQRLLGELACDDLGNCGLVSGEFEDLLGEFDTYEQFQRVENGEQTYVEIKDSNGDTVLVVTPREEGGYNYYDSFGDYVDSVIDAPIEDLNISLKDGFAELYSLNDADITFDPLGRFSYEFDNALFEPIADVVTGQPELSFTDKVKEFIATIGVEKPAEFKPFESIQAVGNFVVEHAGPTVGPTLNDQMQRAMQVFKDQYGFIPDVEVVYNVETSPAQSVLGLYEFKISNEIKQTFKGDMPDNLKGAITFNLATGQLEAGKIEFTNSAGDIETQAFAEVDLGQFTEGASFGDIFSAGVVTSVNWDVVDDLKAKETFTLKNFIDSETLRNKTTIGVNHQLSRGSLSNAIKIEITGDQTRINDLAKAAAIATVVTGGVVLIGGAVSTPQVAAASGTLAGLGGLYLLIKNANSNPVI